MASVDLHAVGSKYEGATESKYYLMFHLLPLKQQIITQTHKADQNFHLLQNVVVKNVDIGDDDC